MSTCICLGFSTNKMCPAHGNPSKAIANEIKQEIRELICEIIENKNKEIQKLLKINREFESCIMDFSEHGTRHDVNPTGIFKDCGCFQSEKNDSWQGYIKSQDSYVRNRAKTCLAKKEN